jgi:hypothetical protein
MTSTLKLTLLAGTTALLATLGAAQAAQAGGFGHGQFGSYLIGGLHDDSDAYGYDDEETDAASAAAAAASALLGDDEETSAVSAAAAAASVLLDDDE